MCERVNSSYHLVVYLQSTMSGSALKNCLSEEEDGLALASTDQHDSNIWNLHDQAVKYTWRKGVTTYMELLSPLGWDSLCPARRN